jgi:hypothetical protein
MSKNAIPRNSIRIFTVDGVKRADLILPNGSHVALKPNAKMRAEKDGYYDAVTGALIKLDAAPIAQL